MTHIENLTATYAEELAYLDKGNRANDVRIECEGGNLFAIFGDVSHDDDAPGAEYLLATNSVDGFLEDADTGYWLVGMYVDEPHRSGIAYGAGDTIGEAYNAACAALRTRNS